MSRSNYVDEGDEYVSNDYVSDESDDDYEDNASYVQRIYPESEYVPSEIGSEDEQQTSTFTVTRRSRRLNPAPELEWPLVGAADRELPPVGAADLELPPDDAAPEEDWGWTTPNYVKIPLTFLVLFFCMHFTGQPLLFFNDVIFSAMFLAGVQPSVYSKGDVCFGHPLTLVGDAAPERIYVAEMLHCVARLPYAVIPLTYRDHPLDTRSWHSLLIYDKRQNALKRYVPLAENKSRERKINKRLKGIFKWQWRGVGDLGDDFPHLNLDRMFTEQYASRSKHYIDHKFTVEQANDLQRASSYLTRLRFGSTREALHYLTTEDRHKIAPCLRTASDANPNKEQRCPPQVLDMVFQIDSLFKYAPRLTQPITLFRGIRIELPKYDWEENSYVFTSPIYETAENYKKTYMVHLTIPRGTPILSFGPWSSIGDLDEIVLPRGGSFIVTSVKGTTVRARYEPHIRWLNELYTPPE